MDSSGWGAPAVEAYLHETASPVLAQLDDAAPVAAAGADGDSFDVAITVKLDPSTEALLASVREAKVQVAIQQKAATEGQRVVVDRLLGDGLTYRDAGHLLGLTYQRVQQLRASGK